MICSTRSKECYRLGAGQFFSQHGFGASRSDKLIWDEHHYSDMAILGTAYEFATGHRLAAGDYDSGRSGALKVPGHLGLTVQPQR
jgi:hypothetical protein